MVSGVKKKAASIAAPSLERHEGERCLLARGPGLPRRYHGARTRAGEESLGSLSAASRAAEVELGRVGAVAPPGSSLTVYYRLPR